MESSHLDIMINGMASAVNVPFRISKCSFSQTQVYFSQLFHYAGASSDHQNFIKRERLLTTILLTRGLKKN